MTLNELSHMRLELSKKTDECAYNMRVYYIIGTEMRRKTKQIQITLMKKELESMKEKLEMKQEHNKTMKEKDAQMKEKYAQIIALTKLLKVMPV